MEERMRILLCEDDENLGMLLREYLQAKGCYADLPMVRVAIRHSKKGSTTFVCSTS